MTTSEKDTEIPGFRNYDKFLEGYHVFSDYFTDGLRYVRGKESKYHVENESLDETKKKLIPIATALIKGAVALQFVGERDFYHEDESIEILIRFKNPHYNDIPIENQPWELLQEVINLLENEEKEFIRIASAIKDKKK